MSSDPFQKFAASVTGEIQAVGGPIDRNAQMLQQLLQSFAITNKYLAVSAGVSSGIADRRSGQTYYIDIGLSLPDILPNSGDYADARVMVNTTRISELVSPSMGEVDIKFTIGVDSFTVHRFREPTPANKIWPISVVCDKLQSSSNARYLTVLSGESGTALSGTAQSVFYGEIPSSLEFRIGYMSPIPTDTNGTLNRTIWPISFGSLWKDETPEGRAAPRILGTNDLLWTSSEMYAMTLRLYCIPNITPRVKLSVQ